MKILLVVVLSLAVVSAGSGGYLPGTFAGHSAGSYAGAVSNAHAGGFGSSLSHHAAGVHATVPAVVPTISYGGGVHSYGGGFRGSSTSGHGNSNSGGYWPAKSLAGRINHGSARRINDYAGYGKTTGSLGGYGSHFAGGYSGSVNHNSGLTGTWASSLRGQGVHGYNGRNLWAGQSAHASSGSSGWAGKPAVGFGNSNAYGGSLSVSSSGWW